MFNLISRVFPFMSRITKKSHPILLTQDIFHVWHHPDVIRQKPTAVRKSWGPCTRPLSSGREVSALWAIPECDMVLATEIRLQ